MKDKVSVIIPIYNVEKYLHRCLNSVIGQSYQNLEIICINDASQDNSVKIIDEYKLKDNRIKILTHKENRGLSSARNTGLDNATGEYVYFIDSDDWIDFDYIEKMVQAATTYNEEIIINTDVLEEYEDTGMCEKTGHIHNTYNDEVTGKISTLDIVGNMHYWVWRNLYKKSTLDVFNIRFPDGLRNEDIYFTLLLFAHINSVYIINGSVYHYTRRKDSITGTYYINHFDLVCIWKKIFAYYRQYHLLDKYTLSFCEYMPGNLDRHIDKNGMFNGIKSHIEKIKPYLQKRLDVFKPEELNFINLVFQSDNYTTYKKNRLISKAKNIRASIHAFNKYREEKM